MHALLTALEDVPNPRSGNTRHDLGELLVIALVSALSSAAPCAEMVAIGRTKESVFRGFLKLKHVIPSFLSSLQKQPSDLKLRKIP